MVELGTSHVVRGDEDSASVRSAPSQRGRARYRSRQQLRDLRYVEDLLVAGRLDEASSLASLLEPHHASMAAAGPTSVDRPRALAAAHPMAHAATVEQACRATARVAAACGDCHRRLGARVTVESAPAPPTGSADRCSPRHRWAIDRLADGVAGALDEPWRVGLEAFATAPLTGPGHPAATRVQAIARDALARVATDTLTTRAVIYSDLLGTCGTCHATARMRRTRDAEPYREKAHFDRRI